ncbi:ubiquitin-specific protease OTU1 SCDLUD_000855 [Saccharomycodes ludwigii]|uniref:ubiquitin-specific protease OTU1 n=1 Tax=Saccharomycodes ludwigii TaxID=36035 RepID=UPI001E8810E8|nr:hypothetical protein SCDLUD_000855 [Saccharomycodes ludwigii]KAH3903234.1 hypothetical protein SCDLUD_000855 [Saccharomycodes ludwigii]
MKLKVQLDNKSNILHLENNSKLSDLVQKILETFKSSTADDDPEDNKYTLKSIRFGYPPKTILIKNNTNTKNVNIKDDSDEDASEDDNNMSKTLIDLGISSGEKISAGFESGIANVISSKDENNIAKVKLHTVPDDNSCLFHAIAYCLYKPHDNSESVNYAKNLRQLCADYIVAHQTEFNAAVLGKPVEEYIKWITRNDTWGGGIEIAILSRILQVGIYVLDVDNLSFDKFNEDLVNDNGFILIAFNGVHYDAIEYEGATVLFDEKILDECLSYAHEWKLQGYTFNTFNAKIKCNICGKILRGEKEVSKHAEQTKHYDFDQNQ